jgi:hypothetical protein
MSFIKIKNPLDKEIVLNYRGENFALGAGESKAYPEPVAKHWREIFGFVLTEGTLSDVEPVALAAEVAVEEVQEAAPKKTAKKK